MLGGGFGQVAFELGDQARIAGEAKHVVDPVGFTPGHQRVTREARVRAQQDLDPRPGRAQSINDAGHLGHSAR
jgi:hypothetical protein